MQLCKSTLFAFLTRVFYTYRGKFRPLQRGERIHHLNNFRVSSKRFGIVCCIVGDKISICLTWLSFRMAYLCKLSHSSSNQHRVEGTIALASTLPVLKDSSFVLKTKHFLFERRITASFVPKPNLQITVRTGKTWLIHDTLT